MFLLSHKPSEYGDYAFVHCKVCQQQGGVSLVPIGLMKKICHWVLSFIALYSFLLSQIKIDRRGNPAGKSM